MEAIESIDRECAALGGLFQQVVNDMKTGVPHYEDFINKTGKLHSQLKSTIIAFGSFLDTFQKIADAATTTKGATREIGSCLTRIVLRHKSMESRMKSLCAALLDCLIEPMQVKIEEWKKVGHGLDKDHSKEYKKLRGELKKKSDNASRIIKKHKKSKGNEKDPKVEQSLADVNKQVSNLHEVEKCAVRRVLVEERSRYCTFISCLKPVLSEEISMVAEFQQLEEVLAKLDKHTEHPFKLPEASEQVLNDIKSGAGGVVFQTPPSSPSSLGSRKSSMCSISSAGSSSGGSSNSPSHQPNGKNRQGVASIVGPMRLSSISSQDSGFTSQDTLFLRPGSPHRIKTPNGSETELSGSGGSTPAGGVGGANGNAWPGLVVGMPGPPMSDRPHTISSAYEKGGLHQRPALQPYTFNPPERIHEEDERERPGSGNCIYEEMSKPPVPQRYNQGERPRVPMKTAAALTSVNQMMQKNNNATNNADNRTRNHHGLPNFSCNQPNMVVPQPVYMNMSDMAAMAERRAAEAAAMAAEDGLDQKTPTAEDLGCLGGDVASGGHDPHAIYNVVAPGGHGGLQRGARPPLQRPFSFTHGVIPEVEFSEALGAQLGVNQRSTLLRRSMSTTSEKPAPPVRRVSSTAVGGQPPPDAVARQEEDQDPGSNNTTPRGSMEFLPPPPPHLLHSDEEDETDNNTNADKTETESNGGQNGEVEMRSGLSVAESVRALQRKQMAGGGGNNCHSLNNGNSSMLNPNTPRQSSPATLRRVQSMSSATPDRAQIKARLDAALSTPRHHSPAAAAVAAAIGSSSAAVGGGEQIYAPVAALQQKIQAQHQTKLLQGHNQPGMVPHPPGPQINPQFLNNQQHQQQQQQQQQQYHQQQQQQYQMQYKQHTQQQQQVQYQHHYQQQQQPHPGAANGGSEYGFGLQFQVHANQWYNHANHAPNNSSNSHSAQQKQYQMHDQIMQEMDPTLGQRPQPPDMAAHLRNNTTAGGPAISVASNGGVPGRGPLLPATGPGSGVGGPGLPPYDSSAHKVRQWIETRTVTDVRKVRPILNQEIQRGFSLKKTAGVNDRSRPNF